MLYDYFANFYEKAGDSKPLFHCPLGLNEWPSEKDGFIEIPDSTPGYLDYIKNDVSEEELLKYTNYGYTSEIRDVLNSGIKFERISIKAFELGAFDDEPGVPPRSFYIHNTSVTWEDTDPYSPVWFIDGDPYEENRRSFRVSMQKLKNYFNVITANEVWDRLEKYFAKGNPWTFDELKEYFEAGIYEAVSLATKTFLNKRDLDGNPQLLHALAVGMAGKTKNEMVVGFLHDVVEDSDTTLTLLKYLYGFSDEVVEAVALLTHSDKKEPYDEYIDKIINSGNQLAITVKMNDLRHNIARGKEGNHKKLVKKHEAALAKFETDKSKAKQKKKNIVKTKKTDKLDSN